MSFKPEHQDYFELYRMPAPFDRYSADYNNEFEWTEGHNSRPLLQGLVQEMQANCPDLQVSLVSLSKDTTELLQVERLESTSVRQLREDDRPMFQHLVTVKIALQYGWQWRVAEYTDKTSDYNVKGDEDDAVSTIAAALMNVDIEEEDGEYY